MDSRRVVEADQAPPAPPVPPVVLFVYNRAETTERVLKALQDQSVRPTRLLVFADGPRGTKDEASVEAVRRIVRSVTWAPLELVERPSNFGCAKNVVRGLDAAFAMHGEAIVLEDDVLPADHFVESLSALLSRYRHEPGVFSVGGYPSLLADALPGYPFDAIVSPRFSVWGWGTWADRWRAVSPLILEFRNPYSTPEEVPVLAGADLRQAVHQIETNPGVYWDYPIALLCLHRGLVHVLTRNYLVTNIGRTTGTHGSAASENHEFQERHTRVKDSVPAHLPPPDLKQAVCTAVLDYLAASWTTHGDQQSPEGGFTSLLRRFLGRGRRRRA